jgi:hypothetical protein
MNIPDYIPGSLKTIFLVKILLCGSEIWNLFDPRSGMGKIRIRDKHPGFATLGEMNKETDLWKRKASRSSLSLKMFPSTRLMQVSVVPRSAPVSVLFT